MVLQERIELSTSPTKGGEMPPKTLIYLDEISCYTSFTRIACAGTGNMSAFAASSLASKCS
jgi:hypothetical protein